MVSRFCMLSSSARLVGGRRRPPRAHLRARHGRGDRGLAGASPRQASSISASRSTCSRHCRRRCCSLAVSCSATAWCCRTAAARARWSCSAAAICARWSWSIVPRRSLREMTLKGLIAPSRIAMVQASQTTATADSRCPRCCRRSASRDVAARMVAASLAGRGSHHLRICARAVPAIAGSDRSGPHRRPARGSADGTPPAISAPTISIRRR